MNNRNRSLVVAGAVIGMALFISGCASAPTSIPAGTYTTQITDADIPPGFPLDVVDLRGGWEFEFTPEGVLHVRYEGEELVLGDYTSDSEIVEFGVDEGPLSCTSAGLGTGRYMWSQDGETITLDVVVDRCDGRAITLTSHPLQSK